MSDELDPELQALLQAERTAPLSGAAEAKGAILAHVLTAGAVTATSAAAAVSGTSASAAGAPTAATTGLAAETAHTAGQVATQTAGTVWTSKALVLFALTTGGIGAAIGSSATFLALSETAPTQQTPTQQTPTPQAPTQQTPRPAPALPAEAPAEEAPPNAAERTPDPGNENGSEEPSTDTPQRAHQTHRAGLNTPPPTASDPARDSSLAAERTLIDRAVTALRAGRVPDAMVALMAHERRFGQSTLAEERDLLSIEALVQQGREEQAQRRLQLFERRYPASPRTARARALLRRSSP